MSLIHALFEAMAVSLHQVDLNLLVALRFLHREGNVTRAAGKLGVTQSAVSHMLLRARRLLGDPLFVRTKRGMIPTPRAEVILAALEASVATLERVLADEPAFAPHALRRTFRVAADDYAQFVLLPALVSRLTVEAPHCDVEVVPIVQAGGERPLESGEIDLMLVTSLPDSSAILATVATPALMRKELLRETFVCLVRKDHALADGPLSMKRFLTARHVLVSPTGRPGGVVDSLLAARGLERRVMVRIPNFLVAPLLIRETDLVVTVGRRLAQRFGATMGLVEKAPPFTLPRFVLRQYWHARQQQDPAHRWLRTLLVRAAKDL